MRTISARKPDLARARPMPKITNFINAFQQKAYIMTAAHSMSLNVPQDENHRRLKTISTQTSGKIDLPTTIKPTILAKWRYKASFNTFRLKRNVFMVLKRLTKIHQQMIESRIANGILELK